MANEINCPGKNADTYYALVKRRTDKYIYDVGDTAFEAVGTWNDARIDECDIVMTAIGDAHYADFPAVAAGVYDIEIRKQAGANPDTDDKAEFIGEMCWDGTAEITRSALDALIDTVKAETSLIGADTGELQTNQGNWLTATSVEVTNLTAIASAVWNALTSGLTTVGSIGKKIADWTVGQVTSNTDKTDYSLVADQSGVTIGTVTTNTDMTGTNNAITSLAAITDDKDSYKADVSALALASACTEARLAELDPANLPADAADAKTFASNAAALANDAAAFANSADNYATQNNAVVGPGGTGDCAAIATALTFVKNVSEGDWEFDTTTTPWQMVCKIKGTVTELVRKNLKDKDGANVTSISQLIGQSTEPA